MHVKKITPVLYAHELEPSVKFWSERFGFQKTVEVPDGGRLAFVILQNENVELMYQSFVSASKDAPAIASEIERWIRTLPKDQAEEVLRQLFFYVNWR